MPTNQPANSPAPLVSVIVPVYRVADYVEKSVKSLFEQDFDALEYIFVDDATPDDSIHKIKQVLKDYPHRQKQVHFIHHPTNQGLGLARKTGFLHSRGDYILHLDSDDYFEPNMVSSMYQFAEQEQADMVVCDFWIERKGKARYAQQAYRKNKEENIGYLLVGRIAPVIWTKLVKRRLYTDNQIFPIKINFCEDKLLTIPLFFCAEKIAYLPQAFVHYRTDNSSITRDVRAKDKHWQDLKAYASHIQAFLEEKGCWNDWKREFHVGNIASTVFIASGNYKTFIRQASLESDKYHYVWQSPYLTLKHKIVFSLCHFHLGKIVQILISLHRKIRL